MYFVRARFGYPKTWDKHLSHRANEREREGGGNWREGKREREKEGKREDQRVRRIKRVPTQHDTTQHGDEKRQRCVSFENEIPWIINKFESRCLKMQKNSSIKNRFVSRIFRSCQMLLSNNSRCYVLNKLCYHYVTLPLLST